MSIFKKCLTLLLLALCQLSYAQNGTIRGKVIDDATGEEMIGVTVVIAGTTQGAATDLEGSFSISAAPGSYSIQASFISYRTITISDITVNAGEVANIGNIRLKENIEQLEDVVVVTAEAIKSSETALLTVKRKSANLLDGISSETFSRIGDGDAGAALKRVPGVSIQEGQYVFVRGLGDRYVKTVLNGVEIPGLDPDRNAIQIDIFPTNIIDNIVVLKTFTPDLSADFVGGMVNIETKSFPEEKLLSVSGSIEYNPSMHFQSDFLTYNGGSTDFLGIDDGTRELPFDSRSDDIPTPPQDNETTSAITQTFDRTMATMRESSLPNISLGLSMGNQISKGDITFGYNGALSYGSKSTFYENAVDAYAIKSNIASETELENDTEFVGNNAIRDVQWNALLGFALKTNRSKISLQGMHIQNGIQRAINSVRTRSNENQNTAFLDILEYTERSYSNFMVNGDHSLSNSTFKIEWAGSVTLANIEDKDVRITPFTVDEDDGSLSIQPTEGGEPNRIWRALDETNYVGKLDLTKEFEFNGHDSKLKFGASNIYKTRDYRIDDFFLRIRGSQADLNLNGDADRLLIDENILSATDGTGVFIEDRFVATNTYEGSINILGAYVMGELGITEKLKSIVGVRFEKYDQRYTGINSAALADPNLGRVFDDELVLSSNDFFPSVNLIYQLQETTNLRASYSRTIARPSFKELSTAEIQDVKTGLTFLGNIDLVETSINNYDLRYEYFFKRGQTVSAGLFYKTLDNPIELVRLPEDPSNIQPTNVGDAEIIGVEVEFRKNLDFISETFRNFSFTTNITWTDATVDISQFESDGRENGLRENEGLISERDMVGQSPLIINANIGYQNFENGWDATLSFNRESSKLFVVGINRTADTFTVPFNSLNLNMSKKFGLDQKNKIGLRVTNILGDVREREYQSFGSRDVIEFSRDPGTAFQIQFSRSF